MDWYRVDGRLAPRFRGAAHRVGPGYWTPARRSIPLAGLLDEALEDDEERDEFEGTFDDWPAHVDLALEGSDARSENVLSALWSSGPGLSSETGLDVVGLDARSYLCLWDDFGGGYRVVALLTPGFDETVVTEVVEQVLLSNGDAIGEKLFWGSPPSEFSTIVSDDVVRRAFEAVRDDDDEDGLWTEYLEAGVRS